MTTPYLRKVEAEAGAKWKKLKARDDSQRILLSCILEFYDCVNCAQSYAITPTQCIKCGHYTFEVISIRICHIKENE